MGAVKLADESAGYKIKVALMILNPTSRRLSENSVCSEIERKFRRQSGKGKIAKQALKLRGFKPQEMAGAIFR